MEASPPFFHDQFRVTPPRAYRKALAEGRLTDDDRRLIEEFLSERQATRHLTYNRGEKSRCDLITWRRFILCPYREMTAGDLYAGLNVMQSSLSTRGDTVQAEHPA